MMWFITKVRTQAIRGIVKTVFPAAISDQGFRNTSSLAPAMAARALATLLSNFSSNCLVDAARSSLYGGAPGGEISNESLLIVSAAHPVMFAMWAASEIILNDLGCG